MRDRAWSHVDKLAHAFCFVAGALPRRQAQQRRRRRAAHARLTLAEQRAIDVLDSARKLDDRSGIVDARRALTQANLCFLFLTELRLKRLDVIVGIRRLYVIE